MHDSGLNIHLIRHTRVLRFIHSGTRFLYQYVQVNKSLSGRVDDGDPNCLAGSRDIIFTHGGTPTGPQRVGSRLCRHCVVLTISLRAKVGVPVDVGRVVSSFQSLIRYVVLEVTAKWRDAFRCGTVFCCRENRGDRTPSTG